MNRARSFLASAAAVAVSAAGLSLVTPATPAFASTSFVLSPTAPVAGESFAATGKVSTRFKRPVVLKVYSGGAWRTAMKGYTTSSGTYRFAGMKVAAPTTYAVAAPAYRYKGKTYGASSSTKRVARPVGQSGFISVLPQVSQRGTGAFRASAALNSVLAKFSPARPGRTVTFQRFVNGSLIGSATTTEGSDGTAVYKVTLGAGQTIKAIAAPRYGAPAVETTTATNDWRLDFDEEFNGSALNTGVWNYRNEGKYLPSRLKSKADRRMVSVSGGTLNLRVKPDPAHAGRFLNSQVSTENSYRFTYGMAAARVKFPTRRGQHGGFWLQSPTYATYPGRPSVGRRGDRRRGVLRQGLHRWRPGQLPLLPQLRQEGREDRRHLARRAEADARRETPGGAPTTCSRSTGRRRATPSTSTVGSCTTPPGRCRTRTSSWCSAC